MRACVCTHALLCSALLTTAAAYEGPGREGKRLTTITTIDEGDPNAEADATLIYARALYLHISVAHPLGAGHVRMCRPRHVETTS